MIFGIFLKERNARHSADDVEELARRASHAAVKVSVHVSGPALLAVGRPVAVASGRGSELFAAEESGQAAALSGRLEPDAGVAGGRGAGEHGESSAAALLVSRYRESGLAFVDRLSGKFAFILWDQQQTRFVLGRDRIGIEPLYYYEDAGRLIVSSAMRWIVAWCGLGRELEPQALARYLMFNYNPGGQTLFRGVRKLRPAHLLVASTEGVALTRYWRLSFRDVAPRREADAAHELRSGLERAVRAQLDGSGPTGIFLSGGMDSSTVAALAARGAPGPVKTFSYRCHSASFDESHHARFMARALGAEHHEIAYRPVDILRKYELVREMDEPFCDIGINVASCLLGQEAREAGLACALTGDGGDELFGGHPVYEADKVAQIVDHFPPRLIRPLASLMVRIPDSDKKKTLGVKMKRFAENLLLPHELLSHRWRTYYDAAGLKELFTPGLAETISTRGVYGDLLMFHAEADGPDLLSRSLYSDYQTVVDFYLRRNDLNRRYGLDTCYPMLAQELVEYCAGLPSRWKIRGWFDTKYLLKKAMTDILPDAILHRKDKLGHSIPFKNWLRGERQVREFVLDFISEETLRKRGLFQPSLVVRLVRDHMEKRRNNSHRLWGLAVLEMWLQQHYDRVPATSTAAAR
jgi:asparagine synthase (glutamine-hydrolysing)